MTMHTTHKVDDINTPRTRNRLLDNTRKIQAPNGYDKDDWTFRKQLEADFRKLGFRSHKFSHKKEPETRLADSLWLSWISDSKEKAFNTTVTDIEARVVFESHQNQYFETTTTTVTITHDGNNGGCYPRRLGKVIFIIEDNSDTRDVLAHINFLLNKPYQRW